MRRLFYPILWSGIVSLLLLSLFIPQWRTHAQATGDGHQKTKISKRILDKVAEGQGSDTVDVIIEATSGAGPSFETALADAGGNNVRKLDNFPIRIVSVPAEAALNLSNRSDVAFVSLDREVRPMGHVSATTGADQVRTGTATSDGYDGSGMGIATVDSGIDTGHRSFLNKSNNLRVVHGEDFTEKCTTDDPHVHRTA